MSRTALTTAAAALAAVIALPASASDQKTVLENVAASSNYTILQVALKEAALDVTLGGKGPFTLFAPTDAAFKKLGEDEIKKLVADRGLLKKIVLAHVVTGKALSAADIKALDGKEVNGFRVSAADGLKIGEAKVTQADTECSNGVIHAIDTVLIPK